MDMYTGLTDKEIIGSVLSGDQQAYAQLVTRYQNYVFTLVLRFTEHREDAEEVAQDVFVKAYRCLADFRGDARFSTWLYTICRTTCLSFLRKKKLKTIPLESVAENPENQWETRETVFKRTLPELKSRRAMVNQAIQMLSADDAQIITLFYLAEQSLEEIGLIIGLEPNSIKVKLHRARLRLKEKMEKNFSFQMGELGKD